MNRNKEKKVFLMDTRKSKCIPTPTKKGKKFVTMTLADWLADVVYMKCMNDECLG